MESNEFTSGLSSFYNEADNAHQTKKFKTKEERLAPYFVPRNAQERFRIFPDKTKNFFAIAHFHYIKAGNRYQKLYCPKHNDGTNCPLCNVVDKLTALENQEVKKKVFNKQPLTEEEKVIADKNSRIYKEKNKWIASKYYIIRGIDKNKLGDGIKFWRFKFSKKIEFSVMDKLSPVLKQYQQYQGHDPIDYKTGADLILTVVDQKMPNDNNRTYKSVSTINTLGPQEAIDQTRFEAFYNNPLTWKEVFVKKNPPHITYEEYLSLITQNKAPYYDETDPKNKRWVYPGNPELELKANSRTTGQTTDNFNEDDEDGEEEITPSSFTSQQVNQHKGVDVTASTGALIDQMISNQQPASPPATTLQSGTANVDEDLLNQLPF